MATTYDDDSDYESDYEPGMTSVYLGFPDDPFDDSMTALDNHLGGQPVWLHPDSPPSKELLQCDNCKEQLHLLTQISAPLLDDEYYDRVLYVFCCPSLKCQRKDGSIKALRAIKRDEKKENAMKQQVEDELIKEEQKKAEKKEKIAAMGESIFGASQGSSNPFGASDSNPFASNSSSNPFDSKAAPSDSSEAVPNTEKSTDKDSELSPQTSGVNLQTAKYREFKPCYYLSVDSEVIEEDAPLDSSKIEMLDEETELPEQQQAQKSTGSKDNDDLINAVQAASNDKTFQHFTHIIGNNPEQVVRYEAQTLEPLFYSDKDAVYKQLSGGISGKKLELQVMPYAIMLLQPEAIAESMEWGTIFVCTSENDKVMPESLDKNGVGYVLEWCGVQWEDAAATAAAQAEQPGSS